MLTLYTAIGKLKIKRDEMGHPVPVVIDIVAKSIPSLSDEFIVGLSKKILRTDDT